jgi:hypothetical protein
MEDDMSLTADFVQQLAAVDEFDACRRVVKKYFGNEFGNGQNDMYRAIESRGIRLERTGDCAYEGMIERDSDGVATIWLRTGLSRRRERFTLAHELGHWLLQEEMLGTVTGQLFRGVSRNAMEVRAEERLASLLAAEILMPFERMFQSFSPNHKLRSLNQICRDFGVSRTAAIRRISDVFEINLLFLQLVPYEFKRPQSLAQVDDAVFVSFRRATLVDRERTRLKRQRAYSSVCAARTVELQLSTPKGDIDAIFDIDSRPTPIPHTFALAQVERWQQ